LRSQWQKVPVSRVRVMRGVLVIMPDATLESVRVCVRVWMP
jgi:hypothetical protein